MKTHIFLVGYMGCGKTTLGVELARELGMPFIDLDDYIEECCEATIKEIYSLVGEAR
ncbi:MAG: AAA family ATPase, partial [Muribaculaceae bacterium]|nr:AAA family ATPase [Muribaculaceae bacterium]